jgi:uncharacterized protein (DUF1786 family)
MKPHGSAPVTRAERDVITRGAAIGVQDDAARLGRDHLHRVPHP